MNASPDSTHAAIPHPGEFLGVPLHPVSVAAFCEILLGAAREGKMLRAAYLNALDSFTPPAGVRY